ncbi:hypothetical protein IFM89_025489 [Coptis chinensis]|uniref:BHLH domain-containing protein n=1 Tax=Coptis chinensis TaxID=261450 RepID=A0A835M4Y5_9MAGN|nr:hypothetical protein IFM89_025489 [Coptis chinensis]
MKSSNVEMTLLERQQEARFQWQETKQSCFEDAYFSSGVMKVGNGWSSGFGGETGTGFMDNSSISRRFSCPPVVSDDDQVVTGAGEGEMRKKRKADNNAQNSKAKEINDKRIKGEAEEVVLKEKRETSADVSKENNSKVSEVQKQEFIHVRARRGQATDSHSLAERVRREKISERMRYLQDLVPGCNKIIGKAGMLDEIINYVQSLQRQVEFLSMKLAAVNPRIDDNIDNFFAKEMLESCTDSFPPVGMLAEVINPTYHQFNQVQQVLSCGGSGLEINHTQMSLGRTTSAPVSVPEEYLDSSCFPLSQPQSAWENDLQSVYNIAFHHQGRSTSFPSEPFTGDVLCSFWNR